MAIYIYTKSLYKDRMRWNTSSDTVRFGEVENMRLWPFWVFVFHDTHTHTHTHTLTHTHRECTAGIAYPPENMTTNMFNLISIYFPSLSEKLWILDINYYTSAIIYYALFKSGWHIHLTFEKKPNNKKLIRQHVACHRLEKTHHCLSVEQQSVKSELLVQLGLKTACHAHSCQLWITETTANHTIPE